METNPYAAPESGNVIEPDNPLAFTELVRAWEKLRLLYNGILLLPGLLVLWLLIHRMHVPSAGAFGGGLFIAAAANIAFFMGPLAELYFRGWFTNGKPIGRGRLMIFVAGLAVSLCVFLLFAILALQ